MRQIGCAPLETPHFLFILSKIAKCPNLPEVSAIQSLVSIERSKGKWTSEDVTGAAGLLGFGENGDLQIVWDEDVDTEFLMKAWWNAWKEVDKPGFGASFWSQDIMDEQAAIKHRLREALRTLCEYKGTKEAMERYEEVISASSLTPNEAYTALGATQDYGDDMMITITDMRVSDSQLRYLPVEKHCPLHSRAHQLALNRYWISLPSALR